LPAESHALRYMREARLQLERALHYLPEEEEYLRDELVAQVHSLRILLDKTAVEEALLRDRDALLSLFESGLGEHLSGE